MAKEDPKMNKLNIFIALIFSQVLFSQQSLKSTLENIIKDKNAKIGVSVWHLEKGDTLSINGNKHLPMQSVFKLHIAMATLDLVDKGKLKLDQKIKLTKENLLQNTWSPLREKYPNGNVDVPLSELITFTVSQSDNNGCDIILDLIGGTDVVQNYMNRINIKDFQIVANEQTMHKILDIQYQNYSSANSTNSVLKKLYTQQVLKKESKYFLIKILEETSTGPKRLKGELPKDIAVAHKTGTSFTENGKTPATNDVGVITLPNNEHIIVSILVSDSYEDDKTNEKIIADIAKASFDYYNKN